MDDQHEQPIDVGPEKAPPPKPGEAVSDEGRQWGMFAHLSGLVAIWLTAFIGGWAGPLVIWLMKKDEDEFVADQAKEALNFQITMAIAMTVAGIITGATCGITIPLMLVPPLLQVIFPIIGAVAANKGERYKYPMTIRLIN